MKHRPVLMLALAWCSVTAHGAPADARQPSTTGWIDECSSDRSFADFRRRLERAVRARDPATLRALVSPTVIVDFGGNVGFAALARTWHLDRPRQSRLWYELAAVMQLGCRREQDLMIMPSFFAALPEGVDPFEVVVATRAGVVRRDKAGTGAPLATFRRGEVLTLTAPGHEAEPWVTVRLSPAVVGHVAAADVRSPLDYRALFGREGGRWVLKAFVAGD